MTEETKTIEKNITEETQPEEILMIKEPSPKMLKALNLLKDDKISLRKVLLAGLVIAVVSSIWGMLTCGWLFNWVYFLEPTEIWKDINFQDSTFNVIFYGGALILNFLFAWVFALIYHGIPGEKVGKGIWYGFLVWLIGILPGMFSIYLWMNIAEVVVIYWLANLLIERIIAGIIVASIYKPREIK
ncbi:MAG: DUF1761 domain-containing protein [Candidatus Kuenenbacteria bacterium]